MAEYKRQSRPGNFRARSSGRDSYGPRESFEAECNKCHNLCQVPFRPNGKKPVYCANCFTKSDQRDAPARSYGNAKFSTPRVSGTPTSDREIQELKRQVEAMNRTLETLVATIETFNRANALSEEIKKYLPRDEEAPEPKKKTAAKAKPATAKRAKKA